jgi:signal transduction histidine kinase
MAVKFARSSARLCRPLPSFGAKNPVLTVFADRHAGRMIGALQDMSAPKPPHPAAPREPSDRQTRIALFAGFGGLLVLLGVLGLSAISFLSQIKVQEENIRQDYVRRERVLQNLRSDIYTSGTYVRDFLLDTNDVFAAGHRDQFLETQRKLQDEATEYRRLIGTGDSGAVEEFAAELAAYMQALAPVMTWNAAERHARAYEFTQDELSPRRMSALNLADRIQRISDKQLEQNSASVSVMLSSFRAELLLLLVLAAASGLTLAGIALWRLLSLEHESQRRFAEVVGTREELKRLSTELVSAQESERRRISRELHDEVGQVLSAIMLGLGNLRSALRSNNSADALRQLQLVEDMTESNARVVRNISLLLRPTMLDDLGLIPALKWLAREVSRTGPMAVDVLADSFVDDIPEEHRTCVFRVVQEALRNAARHSGALQAHVLVREEDGFLRLSVQDDGKGFVPSLETGLGILGMQERVVSLSGTMTLDSNPRKGTTLTFNLPLPANRRDKGLSGNTRLQEISPFRTA